MRRVALGSVSDVCTIGVDLFMTLLFLLFECFVMQVLYIWYNSVWT